MQSEPGARARSRDGVGDERVIIAFLHLFRSRWPSFFQLTVAASVCYLLSCLLTPHARLASAPQFPGLSVLDLLLLPSSLPRSPACFICLFFSLAPFQVIRVILRGLSQSGGDGGMGVFRGVSQFAEARSTIFPFRHRYRSTVRALDRQVWAGRDPSVVRRQAGTADPKQ